MLVPTKPWHSNIGVPAMEPDGLGDQHEPVARPDLAAEPDVLHAAEGDEALLEQLGLSAEEARKLRGRLAHQHARHERVVGHVAPHPELVGLDVLVADDQLVLDVDVDDRRELFHLEPLRVVAARFPPDRPGRARCRWRRGRSRALAACARILSLSLDCYLDLHYNVRQVALPAQRSPLQLYPTRPFLSDPFERHACRNGPWAP